MKKFKVGLLDCCASLHLENAWKKAEKHAIPKACGIEQLIGATPN